MTTKKGRPRVVTALMAVALVATACSKSPAATGAGRTSAPSAGAGGTVARAVEFSQCMRAHGVSGFPDPDPSGQLTIDGVANGSGLDLNAPSFQQALGACKGLEPPGFMGTTRTAQQQQAALGFAQCMRANGVPDFPDPTPGGPLIDVQGARSIPGFAAAQSKCSSAYAGQLGLPGR